MKHDNHKKYALFIGRWQPFHNGHKHIIDETLFKGKNVCVAIRDTELSEKNPKLFYYKCIAIMKLTFIKELIFSLIGLKEK